MFFPNGDFCEGEFKNNLMNGYGTLFYCGGTIYEG